MSEHHDPTAHAADCEPLTYTVPQAAAALQISERHMYTLLDQGRVGRIRLGGRTLISRAEVRRLVAEGGVRARPLRVMK